MVGHVGSADSGNFQFLGLSPISTEFWRFKPRQFKRKPWQNHLTPWFPRFLPQKTVVLCWQAIRIKSFGIRRTKRLWLKHRFLNRFVMRSGNLGKVYQPENRPLFRSNLLQIPRNPFPNKKGRLFLKSRELNRFPDSPESSCKGSGLVHAFVRGPVKPLYGPVLGKLPTPG